MRRLAPLFLALAACDAPPTEIVALPPGGDFTARAIAFLDGLQPRSIAEDRELCGYFGQTDDGAFVATAPASGGSHDCELDWPEDLTVIASYHTHAAWNPGSDSEVPSTDDMAGDMSDRIDGYISTPGGRVWRIEGPEGIARMLCGPGCVTRDPAWRPGAPVAPVYSFEALERREAGSPGRAGDRR